MSKRRSLRRYVMTVHAILALVVVLGYSGLMNWYFMRGMDESNYMNMQLEAELYIDAYERGEKLQLPQSSFSSGYLGWQQVPVELKALFPELKQVNQLALNRTLLRQPGSFITPPEQIIFMLAQPLKDGTLLYLSRRLKIKQFNSNIKTRIKRTFELTWPLALGFLLLILGSVHLILKRITTPLKKLGDWSDRLTLDCIDKSAPDFIFEELDRIAAQQQAAFKRIGRILEKEHDFLRHASHELRTPIAVAKSNAELLERLVDSPKASASIRRIKRATLNMQHMTETLLWLSREDDETLDTVEVDIEKIIQQIVNDNQYLLQSKPVQVQMNLEKQTLSLAETPCRLVLNNLIRNAFQYTAEGEVVITFKDAEICIKNINHINYEVDHSEADYGYGLGLRLVERIVQKMSWQYKNVKVNGGRSTLLKLN